MKKKTTATKDMSVDILNEAYERIRKNGTGYPQMFIYEGQLYNYDPEKTPEEKAEAMRKIWERK